MTGLNYFPMRLCSSTGLLYHSQKGSSTSIAPTKIKEDSNWTRLYTILLFENQSIVPSFRISHNHIKTRRLPSKLQWGYDKKSCLKSSFPYCFPTNFPPSLPSRETLTSASQWLFVLNKNLLNMRRQNASLLSHERKCMWEQRTRACRKVYREIVNLSVQNKNHQKALKKITLKV